MVYQKSKIISSVVSLGAFLLAAVPAFAHVVVKPTQVGVAAFQTFTVGVPNEKDTPTIEIRLLIPEGVKSVSPNVKPGWTIDIKKAGEGENATVSEIDWKGGSIPPEQRDEFVFSAQVPASETTLNWKAYQSYSDGSIVKWDQAPQTTMSDQDREKMEKEGLGLYSTTTIVNDLQNTSSLRSDQKPASDNTALTLSITALALSVVALGKGFAKKK